MTDVRIVTPDKLNDYLAEADAVRARILADARLRYTEATVEAEKAWIASMGARLGWEDAK